MEYYEALTARYTGLDSGSKTLSGGKSDSNLHSYLTKPALVPFSSPTDPDGYNDSVISDDMIGEVYSHFIQVRRAESETLLRCITGTFSRYPTFDDGQTRF